MGRTKIKYIDKECENCNDTFKVKDTKRDRKRRFCSKQCSSSFIGSSNTGRTHSDEVNKSKGRSGDENGFFGKKHTTEFRNMISLNNSGTYEENYGIQKSNEMKAKISEKQTGEDNHFFGKSHTEESRKKISENHRDCKGENNPMFGNGHLVYGEKNGAWQGGKTFELYPREFSKELKTEIRTRDNFTCAMCGKNGYDVHHINYDKQCNEKTNLITLCRSDHAKTNFNRKHWETFFTNIINERK